LWGGEKRVKGADTLTSRGGVGRVIGGKKLTLGWVVEKGVNKPKVLIRGGGGRRIKRRNQCSKEGEKYQVNRKTEEESGKSFLWGEVGRRGAGEKRTRLNRELSKRHKGTNDCQVW